VLKIKKGEAHPVWRSEAKRNNAFGIPTPCAILEKIVGACNLEKEKKKTALGLGRKKSRKKMVSTSKPNTLAAGRFKLLGHSKSHCQARNESKKSCGQEET